MTLTLKPVRVGNGSDEEGMLVFNGNQRLIAVLTHLGDQYGAVSGHWYLETGFGRVGGVSHLAFADSDAAKERINRRLARQP
jgi:hypothetical protein